MLENMVQALGLLSFAAALGYAALVYTGRMTLPTWLGQPALSKTGVENDVALGILRVRLARGEITLEEFNSLLHSLEPVR